MSTDLSLDSPEALWTLCAEQEREGRHADARATLRAFMALSPDHWFAYQLLAHLYALDANFEEASKAFQSGVDAFPACHELIAEYAKFQSAIPGGDLAKAEALYMTAVRLSPYCKDYSVQLLSIRQRRRAAESASTEPQKANA
jgi:tetratricopeptide (TPR) repeat protein